MAKKPPKSIIDSFAEMKRPPAMERDDAQRVGSLATAGAKRAKNPRDRAKAKATALEYTNKSLAANKKVKAKLAAKKKK